MLEIGEEYNTRNGGRIKITENRWGIYSGIYTSPDGQQREVTVTANGYYYHNGKQSGFDIISKYEPPNITYWPLGSFNGGLGGP